MGTIRHNGFALLEALVALVIVTSVGTALFVLVNNSLQNLARAEAHVITTSLQSQLLAWARTIEFEGLPDVQESSLTIWQDDTPYRAVAAATRIHGPVPATTQIGEAGVHQLALYDISIRLYAKDHFLDRIVTRRVASQQVASAP